MSLENYVLLGHSGLRVSPLALGGMTFGNEAWGADRDESRRVFDRYVDLGGNFIDTAVTYSNGHSEAFLGEFAAQKRDRLVISTKYSVSRTPGDPNACGNHRLSMVRSVDVSLKRLRTDRLDMLYLHIWDDLTPVEEIMRGLDDLVRSGKVVYVGISDTPAWRIAEMQTIAKLRGWSPFVGMQIEYSLLERSVEAELIPMANAMGIGVLPWSPLGGGALTAKYRAAPPNGQGRSSILEASGKFSARSDAIVQCVERLAQRRETSAAAVALAWLLSKPGVAAPVIGARTQAQLDENLTALELRLEPKDIEDLDAASAIAPPFPHSFLGRTSVQQLVSGGVRISPRRH